MPWFSETSSSISLERLQALMEQTVVEARRRICNSPRRVLLLPPDITRMHSGAGKLTEMLYHLLAEEAEVHVIPTLGQHVPHTPQQNRAMFGSIPITLGRRLNEEPWDLIINVGHVVPHEVLGFSVRLSIPYS